jgi:hypothetical protein
MAQTLRGAGEQGHALAGKPRSNDTVRSRRVTSRSTNPPRTVA